MNRHTYSHLVFAVTATLLMAACASSYSDPQFIDDAPAISGSSSSNNSGNGVYKLYQGVMQY